MAARLWGLFLAFDLCFAVAVAVALRQHAAFSPCASMALGFAALPAPSALIVVGSFLRAAASARGGRGKPLRLLGALITECVDFDRAILAIVGAPRRVPRPDARAGGGSHERPVLLIHGILCNRGVWRSWLEPLRAAGLGPIRALDLEPLLGSIDVHAQTVAAALEDLQRECGGARVSIIAHSMGGLAARAALRRTGPRVIRAIVTLASPHHGTALAAWLPSLPMRQMRRHGRWLEGLAAAEPVPLEVPITSIYSTEDNMIVPAQSAVLDAARALELTGVGHLGVLFRRRSIGAAIAALAAPAHA